VCPTDFLEYRKLGTASWQPVTVAQNSAGIPSYYLNGSIPTIGPVGEITVSLITGDKLAIDENQLAAGLTLRAAFCIWRVSNVRNPHFEPARRLYGDANQFLSATIINVDPGYEPAAGHLLCIS
jgi:hypothetical protein